MAGRPAPGGRRGTPEMANTGEGRNYGREGRRNPAKSVEAIMGRPMPPAQSDTEVVFDPASYVDGVPFGALARLRAAAPDAWAAGIPVLGCPPGPGCRVVLWH